MTNRFLRPALAALIAAAWLPASAGRSAQTTGNQVFDTSYAVENSKACLGGGCHELDAKLVADYTASAMTHVMVKCNVCHGTHTAADVGLSKPNLTGYRPGMGATGYVVGKDRCLACHSGAPLQPGHPSAARDCIACHAPHVFRATR